MIALSLTVQEIFTIEMCMTLTLTYKMSQGQMQICQSKGHLRLSVLAIATFAPSVTVCEISRNVHDFDL